MKSPNRPLHRAKYLTLDCIAAIISWTLFFGFRKINESTPSDELFSSILNDIHFTSGCFLIPLFWCILHSLFGYYHLIYRKSYLQDISKTLKTCFIGSIILFFFIVLDDQITTYKDYYTYLAFIFFSYFPICLLFRIIITYNTNRLIHNRHIGFNSLLVGSGNTAIKLHKTLSAERKSQGQYFVGYIPINNNELYSELPILGSIEDIEKIISKHKIEEIFIIPEKGEESYLSIILSNCLANNLTVKIMPSTESFLTGAVKISSINSRPMATLTFMRRALWQRIIGRTFEILSCSFAAILVSPLLLYAAYRVKKSSRGNIFYSQERIGLHGKPFLIYKFRSMYIDAEKETPLLTETNDNRVTPWGKIMRKYRIDELPQLYNILRGDMALVGPRPEREYFVEQIVKKAPHYKLLFNVKPGLTSWGETKYGYASNVDEMIERMNYDLVYLENQSLGMDLKIMLFTIGVVFRGEGQ